MASKEDSTGGATPAKGEAARATTGVGGVRSSDDPAPDLWFGQPAEERRDATCVEARKRSDGVVTAGPPGYQRQESPGTSTPAHAGRRKPIGKRHSESRMRENRLSGLMRGGKRTVIGHCAFQSVASRPLYRGFDD